MSGCVRDTSFSICSMISLSCNDELNHRRTYFGIFKCNFAIEIDLNSVIRIPRCTKKSRYIKQKSQYLTDIEVELPLTVSAKAQRVIVHLFIERKKLSN